VEHRDDAGSASHGHGRVRPENLDRLRRASLGERGHVAADGAAERLADVIGPVRPGTDQPVIGAVRDGAVVRVQRGQEDALVENMPRKEIVERRPPLSRDRSSEVGGPKRVA
jgi:hypothetical protein